MTGIDKTTRTLKSHTDVSDVRIEQADRRETGEIVISAFVDDEPDSRFEAMVEELGLEPVRQKFVGFGHEVVLSLGGDN